MVDDDKKNDPRKKVLAARIKTFREAKKLSQRELGEKMERSAEAISQLERGLYLPNFDTMERLCEGLGVSMNELFDFQGTASPATEKQLAELQAAARSLSPKALQLAVSQVKAIQESDLSK